MDANVTTTASRIHLGRVRLDARRTVASTGGATTLGQVAHLFVDVTNVRSHRVSRNIVELE